MFQEFKNQKTKQEQDQIQLLFLDNRHYQRFMKINKDDEVTLTKYETLKW